MVEFWLAVIRRAFWDSVYTIGQTEGSLVFTFIVLLLGCIWVFFKEGLSGVKSTLIQAVIGAPLVAWLMFFLYHLLIATPYLRFNEERERAKRQQERADKAAEANQTKDQLIVTQKQTIEDLQAKLKEQPKVIYRDFPKVSRATPTKINNLLVEVRAVCNLRDPLKLPNDTHGAYFPQDTNFFEGPTGKAYLRPLTKVQFQRTEEEGRASTTFRYDLPSNSDLLGKPISALSEYKHLRLTLWPLNESRVTQCGFLEITLRINGIDVLRRSISNLPPLVPNLDRWVAIPLEGMKLPE